LQPPTQEELYQKYSKRLTQAIDNVYRSPNPGDKYFDIQQRLTANVHIFADCKAQIATELIANTSDLKEQKAIIQKMNSYLATEYTSAINKARSGKQFADFMLHKDTMPNIEWLPSSALHPREAHMPYYYVVRPVDDPFWQKNFPGNLWNCKCDWMATAKPVTNLPDKIVPPSKGLEGNPAITGKIFTNNASWLNFAGEEGIDMLLKIYVITKKQKQQNCLMVCSQYKK